MCVYCLQVFQTGLSTVQDFSFITLLHELLFTVGFMNLSF